MVPVKANEATASFRRVFFHVVDLTDGMTPETGEAGGQPQVSSDGAAWTNTGISTLSAIGNGRYFADLTQALVATAGTAIETRYKSANTQEAPGDSVRVVAYDPYSTSLGLLLAAANLSPDTITAATIATGAITSAKFAAGAIDAAAIATDAITAAKIAADAIGSSELAASAVNEIADQVWDEVNGTHLAVGSTGENLFRLQNIDTNVSGILIQATVTNDAMVIAPAIVAALSTPTEIRTNRGEVDDYHNGATIVVGVGNPAAVRRILDYSQTNGAFTVDALPFTPTAAQTCYIVARVAPESGGSSPATIADAVWDEARAGHVAAGSFGEGVASVQGNVTGSVGSVAAGGITATSIATDAIGSDELAATALTEIENAVWNAVRASHITAGTFGQGVANVIGTVTTVTGNVNGSVGSVAAGGIASTSFAAGAINSAAIATDAIGSDELAASAITEIQAGLATSASIVTAQADLDDIQARLPATLSGGRMRSQVEGMDAGTVTAAVVATDAIDADALAADAVTEIQAGLATAASIVTLQSDTDDLQTRLPATLNGGRMRSHVEAMDAGVITASVIATGAVDADALAADAGTEIAAAVDVTLSAAHGAGAWGGGGGLTSQQVRDSMLLAPTAGAPAAGSVDEHLDDILADTAAMQPLIDVATSTRATNAGVDAAVTASHGVGSYVDSGAAPTVAAIDAQLSGTHGAGAWGGGGGLSQQNVRDALKLAPSAGAPAVGSIDEELDEIMGPGFDPLTDSLEEIRDEVDACCGDSGDQVNVEGI